MSDDITPILEKIKKLFALSTSSNPNEAAAAAAKAQSLLMQHNLTLSHIETSDAHASDYGNTSVETGSRVWLRGLLAIIAQNNFCVAVYSSGMGRCTVIGKAHNQAVVLEMYHSLVTQLETMATSAYWASHSTLPMKSWKDSFYKGAIESIHQRLDTQRREMAAQSNVCRALIVTSDAELQKAVRNLYPHLRAGRSTRAKNNDGYYSGREAGERVALGKVLPGATS